MANATLDVLNVNFMLNTLDLSLTSSYVTCAVGILIYSFTLICNLLLLLIIICNRTLHEPMYYLLFNLSLNDLIGISAVVPKVIYDLMFQSSLISYPACVIQAWCLHIYGGATLLILSVMAFDRFIAICHPLRYHSLISKRTVKWLIILIWLTDFALVGALFGLTLHFPVCRTLLVTIYCDNVSLLRLTCATDITVNNIYGLFITGLFHGIGLFSVVFSYTQILLACFKGNDSDSKSKALHTCATHLLVFLIYELSGFAVVLVYRAPYSPPNLQKFMGMTFVIFPPSLNPIIYGVKTREIKVKMKQSYKKIILSLNAKNMSKTKKTLSSQ
ncbi:olfactory receptor 4D9-like [Chanos chanos]|uniref:Olfactory receptor n=1 Tax=Chanos chanos TaxID=29144 RepID=A0A6J2VPS7_CHACN|nr:olfactory receptor 4D9-like [Chanos chanos]